MNFTALILLGLMGTVCSECPVECQPTKEYHQQFFKLVPDLQNSSVAPWELVQSPKSGREPQYIEHAVCKHCTVKNMIAKPIFLEIRVYQTLYNGSRCRCPYMLAVGCTCVNKSSSMQKQL